MWTQEIIKQLLMNTDTNCISQRAYKLFMKFFWWKISNRLTSINVLRQLKRCKQYFQQVMVFLLWWSSFKGKWNGCRSSFWNSREKKKIGERERIQNHLNDVHRKIYKSSFTFNQLQNLNIKDCKSVLLFH